MSAQASSDSDLDTFQLPEAFRAAFAGQRVLITGSGKNGGLGQGFAFAAAKAGAACVGVHFHSSYDDGLRTVDTINAGGGHAFPIQCDVTSPKDVWATRSYIMEKMGGLPPSILICNSGRSEAGYLLGRVPKVKEEESASRRRARVRQAFVRNLEQSRDVIDTKVDGFLAMTHLWASEASHASEALKICYISSRQAVDPGAGVPGYCLSNWAVVALPEILSKNMGRHAAGVTAFSVGYPFVKTKMTEDYADNPKVFGRWQPRMLATHEASTALAALLVRPTEELGGKFFQLNVAKTGDSEVLAETPVAVTWSEVAMAPAETPLSWSDEAPIKF